MLRIAVVIRPGIAAGSGNVGHGAGDIIAIVIAVRLGSGIVGSVVLRGCLVRIGRGGRGGFGGECDVRRRRRRGLGRRRGRGQGDVLQGKALEAVPRIVKCAAGRDGEHVDRVDLADFQVLGAQTGAGVRCAHAELCRSGGVLDVDVVAVDIARGGPVEGDVAGLHVAHAVLPSDGLVQLDLRLADLGRARIGLLFDVPEADGGTGDMLFIAVLRVGCDGQLVGAVDLKRRQ